MSAAFAAAPLPAPPQTGPVASIHGLNPALPHRFAALHWNWPAAALCELALSRGEGQLSADGAFVALTGAYTGRSPQDRTIVEDRDTKDTVWWGASNRSMTPAQFDHLMTRIAHHLEGRAVQIQDLVAGADPRHSLPLRLITPSAWHAWFAQNMFRHPGAAAQARFTPALTILHAPELKLDPASDGTRSEVAVALDLTRGIVLIAGTRYAGEIKKSVFSALNYWLPTQGVLPMHCSANIGEDGRSAVFFGLSGTGKTTLSADASRRLIGDDEHGWSDQGLFNFEGGCYAKAINLSPDAEPEIFSTTRRFGTIMENVVLDPDSRRPDFADARHAENTRLSYPLGFIPNAEVSGLGPAPATILMLTCDAFGVLPPIARLTPAQAMYHFLSGYTARVAGTERGVTAPQAVFSTCFGAPFMPRHPVTYARMLGERIQQAGATCYLVNTGWSGGGHGTGVRMALSLTRRLVDAALDGSLAACDWQTESAFGLSIPVACPGVPAALLAPHATWRQARAYDQAAATVAGLFQANFAPFQEAAGDLVGDGAIQPPRAA